MRLVQKILNRIQRIVKSDYDSSQFKDYEEYVEIQHRCEPKEFMDHRLKILSAFTYALNELDKRGIAQKIRIEEGVTKNQLIEDQIKILDAGVRDGWTIELLNSLGYPNALGIELLDDYVAYAKQKGRNVQKGDVHKLEFPDDSFDFVFSRHTLEHCLDPLSVLNGLLRVTKTGGALYCSFPLVAEPHGKHTLAISNLRTIHRILKDLDYSFDPIFIGKTSQTPVIPEGNEAIIFIIKKAKG